MTTASNSSTSCNQAGRQRQEKGSGRLLLHSYSILHDPAAGHARTADVPVLRCPPDPALAFPQKVLQFHLSPAEQIQLQRSVALTRPKLLVPRRPRRARRGAAVTSPRRRPTSRNLSTFYHPATPPVPTEPDPAMPLPEQNYIDAMERWRTQEEKLDEYRQKVADAERAVEKRHRSRSRRPSFRRAFSLLPEDSEVTALSAMSLSTATSTSTTSSSLETPRRKSFSRKRASAPAPPHTDTRGPSHYYQDPEARRKLKLCLASPQKFQEAIEYGFPTSPKMMAKAMQPVPNFSRPRASHDVHSRARAGKDAQRFLKDNSLSFLDDNSSDVETDEEETGPATDDGEDDDASEPELDSPVTPADGENFRRIGARQLDQGTASLASSGREHSTQRPDCVPDFADVPWPPMREMTMRMTLTRPELRAREEDLYGFLEEDPLALQALPPPMADHAALGHRRSESGKVRSLWSKMKPGKPRR